MAGNSGVYLNWKDDDHIDSILRLILDTALGANFCETVKRNLIGQDLPWDTETLMNRAIAVAGHESDWDSEYEMISTAFERNSRGVVAYHATRTEDLVSFFRDGIVPLDVPKANKLFEEKFLCDQFPEVTKLHVSEAIESMKIETREGKSYFGLDDAFLLKSCGHYLIYGSEYRLALATRLATLTGNSYRDIFRTSGTPTMFKCNIPWELMSFHTAKAVQRKLSWLHVFQSVDSRVDEIDFAITLSEPLPSQRIVDHYFPSSVSDPLTRNVYTFK